MNEVFEEYRVYRDTRYDEPKSLTWEELKEEAKKMGAVRYPGCIVFKGLEFIVSGEIFLAEDTYDKEGNEFCACVAKGLVYDQMLAIMKALR